MKTSKLKLYNGAQLRTYSPVNHADRTCKATVRGGTNNRCSVHSRVKGKSGVVTCSLRTCQLEVRQSGCSLKEWAFATDVQAYTLRHHWNSSPRAPCSKLGAGLHGGTARVNGPDPRPDTSTDLESCSVRLHPQGA